MNESQCMARLLASAVHDMRNVLAVIRESAGLAQDLATFAGGKTVAAPGAERLSSALSEVQRSIIQGAALSEDMDFMAQAGGMEPGSAGPCDLARVSRSFCLLAARQARAAQMASGGISSLWKMPSVEAAICSTLTNCGLSIPTRSLTTC